MSSTPFVSCPATGTAFIGREGLVRSLRTRMAQGESLAVIGGPKLGKTSLVRSALGGLSDRAVFERDLATDPSPRFEALTGSIVVLDNLDALDDSAIESLLAGLQMARLSGLVVTGGRRLRTMLGESRTGSSRIFRLYPLSVLLDGELRQLIGTRSPMPLAAWTGNHPYLTKLFLHYGDRALDAGRSQWEPFVRHLDAEIGAGQERRLLSYLIERGAPVNPTLAGSETGILDIKAVADTLVYLGAISRWIRNEEATLFAGCRLLNDFISGGTSGGAA